MPKEHDKFVIISQPRSGSYYFQSLLDSAEDIVCQGEIFKTGKIELDKTLAKSLGLGKDDIAERDKAPFAFVNRLRQASASGKIFGFKAFWPHLEPHNKLMDKIVLNPEWKKIFLVRNPLHTYASLLRAKKTEVWVNKEGKSNPNVDSRAAVTVHFDPSAFEKHWAKYCRVVTKNHSIMAAQTGSCLEVGYGDINKPEGLDTVLGFLGSVANSQSLSSEYQKQFRGSLLDGFDNPDDVTAYLDKQGLQEMVTTTKDVFL